MRMNNSIGRYWLRSITAMSKQGGGVLIPRAALSLSRPPRKPATRAKALTDVARKSEQSLRAKRWCAAFPYFIMRAAALSVASP